MTDATMGDGTRAQELRQVLWRCGYRPVAIYSLAARCRVPGKQPVGAQWEQRARQNPPEATLTRPADDALNTGILCDGLQAVDIDVEDAEKVKTIEGLALAHLGLSPVRYRENSYRLLLPYRAACGEPRKRLVKGPKRADGTQDKVEILGRGCQFVADGLHPSGARIRWRRQAPLVPSNKLAPVTEDQITAFLAKAAEVIEAPPAHKQTGTIVADHPDNAELAAIDADALAAIVAQLPNGPQFDDRGQFVAMAHALAAAFPNDPGLAGRLWHGWCDRWHRGLQRAGEVEFVWDSVRNAEHHIGADWIISRASAAGIDTKPYALRVAREEFEATEDPPQDAPLSVEFSDDALALAFSAKYDGQLIFVPGFQRWLYWSGDRWAEDDRHRVFAVVRDICREKAALAEALDEGAGRRVCSFQTVAAVERLARSDPRHARSINQFDDDPWALNTPTGVIDLRTGVMRPHQRGDLFTKVATVAPAGACLRWTRFLSEITQGDSALVEFLQRYIGYSLTGTTSEHAFVFLWGPGGNGKSVLLGTVAAMLGSYATTAMADVFTLTHSDQHPTHVATLRGARFVMVTETEEGRPWAESRIKSLTGGDRISARVMRGDPFEFVPTFKLWIAGNHRPVLRNPDPAMKRRLHLVPLTFVPPQPDTSLPAALKEELGGILAWAIDGCLAWQKKGLQPPPVVAKETAEYFADQDLIGQWIGQRCTREPTAREASGKLYADWAAWAQDRGERPRGEKWFSPALERHFAKRRTKAGMEFEGVRLLPVSDELQP